MTTARPSAITVADGSYVTTPTLKAPVEVRYEHQGRTLRRRRRPEGWMGYRVLCRADQDH